MVTNVARVSPQYGEAPDQTFFEAACTQAEIRSQAEDAALAPQPPVTGSEGDTEENPLEDDTEALSASQEPPEGSEKGATPDGDGTP